MMLFINAYRTHLASIVIAISKCSPFEHPRIMTCGFVSLRACSVEKLKEGFAITSLLSLSSIPDLEVEHTLHAVEITDSPREPDE